MSIINRKKVIGDSIVTDHYVPSRLPSEGDGLENYVATDYPMNDPVNIAKAYTQANERLNSVLNSCDIYSDGSECDYIIDSQIAHVYEEHEAVISNAENQITRILSARSMRKKAIERKLEMLQDRVKTLVAAIEPLKELESQFCIHLGHKAVSIGVLVTLAAMVVDGLVNYSFLSEFLLQNWVLLIITVVCMSICSDGCMWGLATYLNHKEENFTNKPVFWMVCAGLLSAFLLSVVASVMIRYGSMDATFGNIGADGEIIPKESYTMAEYGTTLISAFVTTATGILSFGFSIDKNSFRISIRERKEAELECCLSEIDSLMNELALIENAPDPRVRDAARRAAAERQIQALRIGLKVSCRKFLAEHFQNPDFTEAMAKSGEALTKTMAADTGKAVTTDFVTTDKPLVDILS